MDKMKPFWDRVGEMLLKYDDDLGKHKGYFEVTARDIIYRSLPMDHHGLIEWVSWKPFKIIHHFSYISDPDATIKWVKYSDVCD
jgi:hypothetical protein